MIEATRRWFRRNRNSLLVGAGVIGAGYLAGQYVLGRIREASQRMRDDKTAKDNLRGRFERNQDDCTYTVLALLPTIRDEIIGALPVEQITEQLQQERQERLKRLAASEAPSSEYPSAPASTVDDASTASFVHTSQMGMSAFEESSKPKRSKAQLWQDMKINSIARALSLLYTLALLNLLTRIQLNLLGRRTYLASVVSMASPASMQSSTISLEDRDELNSENAYGNDFETNRMYLTFSWWILHRGAKNILERVMAAVKEVFASVNIREDMSMERLSELIIEVRRRVEGASEQERRQQSWLEYLLPPRSEELFVMNQANQTDSSDSASPEPQSNPLDITSISPSLRRLLDETADLIESPTFSLVLGHLLDTGFSHLVDSRIASEAFKASMPAEGVRVSEVLDTKCKLAHILPVFCRQAHAIVSGGEELVAGVDGRPSTNEYLVLMDRVHDLEAFAAVIYSSNFEYEVVDSPRLGPVELPQSVQQTVLSVQQSVQQTARSVQQSAQQALQSAQELAKQTVQSVQESVPQTVQSVQQSVQHSASSAQQSAKQTALSAQESAKQTVQSIQQSVKQSIESVQESVISLADSSIEKLDLTSQGTTADQSQSTDPLGESAVAIDRTDLESSSTSQSNPSRSDFESAWWKATGNQGSTQASAEVVNLPAGQTDIDVLPQQEKQASAVVPTMEAASEVVGVPSKIIEQQPKVELPQVSTPEVKQKPSAEPIAASMPREQQPSVKPIAVSTSQEQQRSQTARTQMSTPAVKPQPQAAPIQQRSPLSGSAPSRAPAVPSPVVQSTTTTTAVPSPVVQSTTAATAVPSTTTKTPVPAKSSAATSAPQQSIPNVPVTSAKSPAQDTKTT